MTSRRSGQKGKNENQDQFRQGQSPTRLKHEPDKDQASPECIGETRGMDPRKKFREPEQADRTGQAEETAADQEYPAEYVQNEIHQPLFSAVFFSAYSKKRKTPITLMKFIKA